MNLSKDLLLKSLHAVLFGEKLDASDFAEADWKSIFQLADDQTVSALLLDGMNQLPSECIAIPLGDKLKRIATMQRIEQINRFHRKVITRP
ncbi:MAG: hypothetical protein EGS53_00245 [Prevotella sp.]|nr:hypothetical protein [Prevotella sp.]